MKFRLTPALVLAGLINPILSAHEFRMHPVEVKLKIEADRVRVHIDAHAEYWTDEIMNVPANKPLPARDWDPLYQSRAKDYISKSFQIFSDGRALAFDDFRPRFIQEPFGPSAARVEFDISYPVAPVGARLSGRAQFFREYYEEIARSGQRHEEDGVFVTRLKVVGKEPLELEIPYEKPDFEFVVAGREYTEGQKKKERFKAMLLRVVSSPFFWIALIFIFYRVHYRFFRRSEE